MDLDKIQKALDAQIGLLDLTDQMSVMSMRSSTSTVLTTSTLASISRATTSSKSKKKVDRQRMRGKPGSPFEREFLRDSLKDLFNQVHGLSGESKDLVQFLVDRQLYAEARQLQCDLEAVV